MEYSHFLNFFGKRKKYKDGYKVVCPAHQDTNPSLYIKPDYTTKKTLIHCFAGCTPINILDSIGLKLTDLFWEKTNRDYTIEQLALEKNFTVKYLESLGICNKNNNVKIPYYLENGNISLRYKYRSWKNKHCWTWWNSNKKGKILPYGLWRLNQTKISLFVVEGESDCWTLWKHGISAIGIPGNENAKLLKKEHIQNTKKLYLVQENDSGGKLFVENLTKLLESYHYTGKINIIILTKYNDINDMYKGEEKNFLTYLKAKCSKTNEAQKETIPIPKETIPIPKEKLLKKEKFKTTSFPIHIFPAYLQEYIENVCASYCDPPLTPDYISLALLTIASSFIGNTCKIRIDDGWESGSSLYSAIIGESGSGKSPIIKKAIQIVKRIEQELQKINKDIDIQFKREKINYEIDINEYKQKKRKDINAVMPETPEKPRHIRAYTSDFTVEALSPILHDNPKGLLIYRDELSGWLFSLNQYKGGQGADKQFFLEAWSADGGPIDRVGKETLFVPNPCISILGSIQPDMLEKLKGNKEDGMLQRFIFCYPEHKKKRWHKIKAKPYLQKIVFKEYKKIFEATKETVIELTPNANNSFAAYWELLENEKDNLIDSQKRIFWAKLSSQLTRVALIITILHKKEICDSKLIGYAQEFIQWQKDVIDKITSNINIKEDEKEGNIILEYMKKKEIKKISARKLIMNHIPKCTNMKNTLEKLAFLVESGFARWCGKNEIEID